MGKTSRSTWTQEARNHSITRDFPASLKEKAQAWTDKNDPVQCIKCNHIRDKALCIKTPGSRDYVCIECPKIEEAP